MSLIKNIILNLSILFFINISLAQSEELKKIGKFKDWETLVLLGDNNKVCFAQSKPVLQSPKKKSQRSTLICEL